MANYPPHIKLPDNATVKDINAFKKKINWGEIPAFFHLIANAIAEAEGFITYGFDNAYKKIIDRRNWNYNLLGIDESIDLEKVNHIELLEPLRRPRICLYHVFNTNGYELLAFPYLKDTVIDDYKRDDPYMEFRFWDPTQMKVLVRLTQLHKFIAFNIKSGDDADQALIIHAHLVVNRIIEMLKNEVDVVKVKGMTIRDAYGRLVADPAQSPNEIVRSQLDLDDLNL